ncbi:ribonucleotide reductase large subunit [Baekduia alba]|uniref:NAD(P)/FAD-dependent oxidoreductase n=1 Tax=Baekduia alba TaxID=2997333 RepID=UPI0023412E72|nr:FAD-dependent oxidoreductase [Baekduia alba]WCB96853.1 ribonucleotide reductase large subunit [Baekduia alba]
MAPTVAVIGGGYGGIAVAKDLDEVADVVLIDPRDTFVHNVAALRSVVDPGWAERLFLSYEGLLSRGRVLRDRAVLVEPGRIELASGEPLEAEYIVLATGSTYPFPAKLPSVDSTEGRAALAHGNAELAGAESVLIVGAGAVGLEFAGEITATWPDKRVTIVDPIDDVLAWRYSPEFRAEVRRQLVDRGVELVLGSGLVAEPLAPTGVRGSVSVTTEDGRELNADIWYRCYGVTPVSDYLGPALAAARALTGHVVVTDDLRLPNQDRVFAIGDVTAIAEGKQASAAAKHAEVVAANIRTLIEGGDELTTYQPDLPMLVLPLGPEGGASYVPAMGGVVDTATTIQMKSADLFVGHYAAILGTATPAAP